MGIARTLLRPIAYAAGKHAYVQVRKFLNAHQHTATVQNSLLMQLLRLHEDTAFGRDHGFANIHSYAEFARSVPISTYDDLRPYMDRVLAGETTALLPADQNVLMFSMTSGTTGKPKHIAVTEQFALQMKRGWNVWGVKVLTDHKKAWLRNILQITSPMKEALSPTGIPCGAISGLLAKYQKTIVRKMYVTTPAMAEIVDADSRYYTILRCAAVRDVSFISTANPSSTIRLIETGQKHCERFVRDIADGTLTPPASLPDDFVRSLRLKPNRLLAARIDKGIQQDGMLLPRHFWDITFLANWTGGTLKLYLKRLRELFGDVPIRDLGLLASEGRFTTPLESDSPAGVAEITGNFLEFIPAEQRQSDNPQTLLAHELELGQDYFIVATNLAALWRYDLDDCVRVVGHMDDSPILEFLFRGSHTANMTGEKITEHQVVEAMNNAKTAAGAHLDRFRMQGKFARVPYYQLSVEASQTDNPDLLAKELDQALGELNMEYLSKRKSGRLGPIKPIILDSGTFDSAEQANIRKRGGRTEQYKHQYLCTDVITEDVD